MLFELIPVIRPLHVEGHSGASGVGDFAGEAIAIGLRGGDPVAEAAPEAAQGGDGPEGLLGWGDTYLLVADPRKPAPVWVAKNDVSAHRLPAAAEDLPPELARRSGL